MSLADLLRNACVQHPQRTALCFNESCWTYAELNRLTDDLAAGLSNRGTRVGNRLAFLLPNGPELVFTDPACSKLGAVAVPLNIRLKSAEWGMQAARNPA